MSETIDVVLPVHNEATSIGKTLEEFHQVVAVAHGIPIRFVVCEDGSTDNTVKVVKDIGGKLPVLLISEQRRKGYSRAVIDGFKASTSSLIGFVDSDNQYDPADFVRLHGEIQKTNCDLVVGYRNPRKDPWIRLIMSGLFNQVYKSYFEVGLKDPSCPYLIIRRDALERILKGNAGVLRQGFWWEFYARAKANDLKITQIPVVHRWRLSGATQVYKPTKVPGIAWTHLKGLAALHRELRHSRLKESSRSR